MIQFPLYNVVLPTLQPPYIHAWPLLFVLSLALLAVAAAAWNSVEGNRFLSVGIGPLLERRARQRRERREAPIILNVFGSVEAALTVPPPSGRPLLPSILRFATRENKRT